MKKGIVSMCVLTTCVLLCSCGQGGSGQEGDRISDESDNYPLELEDVLPECGEAPESYTDMPKCGEPAEPQGGGAEGDDLFLKEKESLESAQEQEDVLLSEKLLKAGDTLEVLHFTDENTLEKGLEVTLKEAKLHKTPEEANLDRALMEKETENYDLAGDPFFCSIDEAGILTCNLSIKNVSVEQGEDLHIGEIMIAYVDPATQKVSIVSCMPAYFSASSSTAGASNYYHYAIPKGESKDMTVAWLIPEEYQAKDLYLCVTYDAREPQERQYFQLFGQE